MKPHIVIINDLSVPKGGASFLAVESARAFARLGHRVTFICGDSGNDDIRKEGIELVPLGQDRLLAAGRSTSVWRGIYNNAARNHLAQWIAGNDGDAVVYHLHGWAQIFSPSVFLPLKTVADRLVMSAHDFFATCPNGAMFNYRTGKACPHKPMSAHCITDRCDRRSELQKIWRLARHSALALARSGFDDFPPMLLVHRAMAPYFARSGVRADAMYPLPNPVIPFLHGRVPAESNRQALFVGRIEQTKGIDLAAEACRRAGLTLVAVGDGALLPELRRQYPEHRWLGRMEPDRIGPIAAQARMLLMPSIYMEPFGLTAVEALWSGIPVICSGQSLLADDIVEAGAGIAIDPKNLHDFAKVLMEWSQSDTLLAQLSQAAFAQTRHIALTWDVWIDRLLTCYNALLQGGRTMFSRHARAFSEQGRFQASTGRSLPEAANTSHAARYNIQ